MSLHRLNIDPSRGQLRVFGILTLVFLGVVGAVIWHRGLHASAAVVWSAAAVIAALGTIYPRMLRPVYLAAVIITYPIGVLSSLLILGATYYLVLTPVGLMLRLFGRDPLRRRFESKRPTYWKPRGAPRTPSSYLHQY